jgi:hypothetical protein
MLVRAARGKGFRSIAAASGFRRTRCGTGCAGSAGRPPEWERFTRLAGSLAADPVPLDPRRAQRAGITVPADGAHRAADGAVPAGGAGAAALPGERAGDALMVPVAQVREAGLDPELELRSAARRFAGWVREQERSAGPTS